MQCVRETMLTMLPEMGKKSHKPSGLCCQSDTVSQKKKKINLERRLCWPKLSGVLEISDFFSVAH